MTTEAGKRLYRWLHDANEPYPQPPDIDEGIAAIEAEAVAAEVDHWRRLPGTYRTEDGGLEVVVDVPESASYVKDEFPDEVALIQTAAVAAERARIADAVRGLPGRLLLVERATGFGGRVIEERRVLAIVELP